MTTLKELAEAFYYQGVANQFLYREEVLPEMFEKAWETAKESDIVKNIAVLDGVSDTLKFAEYLRVNWNYYDDTKQGIEYQNKQKPEFIWLDSTVYQHWVIYYR